jgi:hypothetical protein
MPDLCALLPADAELSVRANAAVSHGGCVVRSAEGTVDARIETQFRRMRFGVIGEDAAPAAEAPEPAPRDDAAAPAAETATDLPIDAAGDAADDAADDGSVQP